MHSNMSYNKLELKKSIKPIFDSIYNNIFNEEYLNPQTFIIENWNKYQRYIKNKKVNNNQPGKVFETLFEILLIMENIKIYSKDKIIDGVPLVKPDFLLKKNDNNFIFLSLKTSLRERWKQADWEAIKFKKKYNLTECYIITLEKNEIKSLKRKIDEGLLDGGLDGAYFGLSGDINYLVDIIKNTQK